MKGNEGERQGEILHLLVHSPKCPQQPKLGQPNPGTRNSFQFSHMGSRDPSNWPIMCFSPSISACRWIWSDNERPSHYNMECKYPKWQLHLLCHNAHPKNMSCVPEIFLFLIGSYHKAENTYVYLSIHMFIISFLNGLKGLENHLLD